MSLHSGHPLVPKDGKALNVIIVARISTEHQDHRSLADQIAMCDDYIRKRYGGEIAFTYIQSQGSGEHLDRAEITELEARIETGIADVVLTEDLARICRRKRAYDICELCQDHGVRLIAINDRVDTGEPGWEDSAFIATWHHERSNRDTSDRIKRSLNNRFDNGQLIEGLVYGYIREPNAKTDLEVHKDPAAEPVIRDIFDRLLSGASYSEVADILNKQNVQPGPRCRTRKWACAMVSRLVHSVLLKGIRTRNRRISRRTNKTGRHRAEKASPELLRTRNCPHLAFFDAPYYDHVIRVIDERNKKFKRGKNGKDSRAGVSRKRTRWPGQHACCGVCGRQMYWTRVGLEKGLLCSGAQNYVCWNSIILPGKRCQEKIFEAMLQAIAELPDFDTVFAEMVQKRLQNAAGDRAGKMTQLEHQIGDVSRRLESIVNAMELQPGSKALADRLSKLESDQAELQFVLSQVSREPVTDVALPNLEELRSLAEGCFRQIAEENDEAGRLLNLMTPKLYIVPYRAIDNDAVIARAHITLHLSPLLSKSVRDIAGDDVLIRELVVDLNDLPQRVVHRHQVVSLRSQGLDQRQVGRMLGITQPAVQNALQLHSLMQQIGTADPYVPVHNVSECTSRLRRHKHARFRFEPLEGFPL